MLHTSDLDSDVGQLFLNQNRKKNLKKYIEVDLDLRGKKVKCL